MSTYYALGVTLRWKIGRYDVVMFKDMPCRWVIQLEVFRGTAEYMLMGYVVRTSEEAAMRKAKAVARAFARKIAIEVLS